MVTETQIEKLEDIAVQASTILEKKECNETAQRLLRIVKEVSEGFKRKRRFRNVEA